MNNTTVSAYGNSTKSLSELNSEEALHRLPVIIFIGVLIVLGIAGNVHVLYIYYRKFTKSTYRIFVLSLATIDLISCFISMPFEISDELNPYMFKNAVACKVFRFVNFTLAISTGLMLVVIASERYRRICKPQGKQLTERQSIYALIGVVACASLVTLPALYIYGSKTFKIRGYQIKATECTWGDHLEGAIIGYIFYGFTLLIVIACMISLVVIYSIVGRYIWKHTEHMALNLKTKYKLKKPSLEVIKEETVEEVRRARDSFRFKHSDKEHVLPKPPDVNNVNETCNGNTSSKEKNTLLTIDKPSPQFSKPINRSPLKGTKRRKEINSYACDMKGLKKAFRSITGREAGTNPLISQTEKSINDREKRITKVLFTITLLFIISFLPYVVILIAYSADESYEKNMSKTEHVIYLIGLRLYLLNNVVNPFLYSSFDSKLESI